MLKFGGVSGSLGYVLEITFSIRIHPSRKEGSTLMAKGKMGERVSEDAQLKLTDLVVDCGYKAGSWWDFCWAPKK